LNWITLFVCHNKPTSKSMRLQNIGNNLNAMKSRNVLWMLRFFFICKAIKIRPWSRNRVKSCFQGHSRIPWRHLYYTWKMFCLNKNAQIMSGIKDEENKTTKKLVMSAWVNKFDDMQIREKGKRTGADAIKKFTPSLGIPSLGVRSWGPLVTPKSGLLNF